MSSGYCRYRQRWPWFATLPSTSVPWFARSADELTPWLAQAGNSDLRSFAAGLHQDEQAVRAALTLPWSNGQVEGQVSRLKLIKRQGYGRAKLDLLRARLVHAA